MTTFERVARILDEALGIDADSIREADNLIADLGAESIDMMDIQFRVEKAFGVRLRQDELFPTWLFGESEFVARGRLTEVGRERVKKHFPFVAEPLPDEAKGLLTVGLLVGVIAQKMAIAT